MKILIEMQCYNRKHITEICLNQLITYKQDSNLRIVNDYSTEYDNEWLNNFSNNVIQYEKKLTINKLKYRTFKNFLDTDYTHLYMTDNDMYHDPNFITFLKKYNGNNIPITLYRSSFIHSFGNGVSRYMKIYGDVSLKAGLYGGASVFLNRNHIEKIVKNLPENEDLWSIQCEKEAWDSKIQKIIDPKRLYLIPNESLCEHFGWNGANHKKKLDDYALNPTEFLKNETPLIWKKLEELYNEKIN